MSLQRSSIRGNAEPSKLRANRAEKGAWFVRVSGHVCDKKGKRLSPAKHRLLEVLEGYCRGRCWCYTGNEKLAERYGAGERTVQRLLEGLEADEVIRRVELPGRKCRRAGIVLLKRFDLDKPVADPKADPEGMAAVEMAIRERVPGPKRKRRRDGSSTVKTPCSSTAKVPGSSTVKVAPRIRSLSFEVDEPELEAREGGEMEPSERQRPEPDPAPAEPQAPPPEPAPFLPSSSGILSALGARFAANATTAAPPRPAPPRARLASFDARKPAAIAAGPTERTDGQVAWLGTLSADQRARFDAFPAKVQARLLAPHTDGINPDPIIAGEAARTLAPPREAPPPPSMPATTAELLAKLRGSPPSWSQAAAEAMVQDFGRREDRNLWRAFHSVTEAVCRGAFPAEAVVESYRKAMGPAARNRGAIFKTELDARGWGEGVRRG